MVTSVISGDPRDFHQLFETHVLGAYYMAHHLLPLLLGIDGGAKVVVAVSSLGA